MRKKQSEKEHDPHKERVPRRWAFRGVTIASKENYRKI